MELLIGILIWIGLDYMWIPNRFPFMRAITARSPEEAEMSRKHNDANVLWVQTSLV